MYAKRVVVKNALGLHARPTAVLVATAKGYQSSITIRNTLKPQSQAVNAKSIVRILAEGIAGGVPIEIAAKGADEVEAVDALVALIESGTGEE